MPPSYIIKQQEEDKRQEEYGKKIDKDIFFYYVKVCDHFTTFYKLKFDKVMPDFFGCGRQQFLRYKAIDNEIFGRLPNGDLNDDSRIRLDIEGIEKYFIRTEEKAIIHLKNQLEKIVGYDWNNMATRTVLANEVNKRFGCAMSEYYGIPDTNG